jgi:hypothetical protein
MSNADIRYTQTSEEARVAWFRYKKTRPDKQLNLLEFLAGWNAAKHAAKIED